MTGRQVFSEAEKMCIEELIVKYKLNSTLTIGAGNSNVKKISWARLTDEFNSFAGNSKRTEAQLKKCWDNLKTRRKQALALEKRERMKTGGGTYIPSTPQDTQEIDDSLEDLTDVEMRFVFVDSDSVPQSPDESEDDSNRQSVESPRPSGSQQTDHGARATQRQGATNVRSRIITKEFNLRKGQYEQSQRRDEELHKMRVAEQEWLLKAAKEKYNKARLERECAEELLRFNQAQREEAELKLKMLKNNK